MWTVAAISFWRTRSPSRWLGLKVGGHLGAKSAFIKLLQWLCRDDSTINIISVIIIIIIIPN